MGIINSVLSLLTSETHYLMVQVDDITRYPEVGGLYSHTARAIIPTLGSIFARGINSQDAVTPVWPEANGEADIFVKTIKKPIKNSKDGKQGLAM